MIAPLRPRRRPEGGADYSGTFLPFRRPEDFDTNFLGKVFREKTARRGAKRERAPMVSPLQGLLDVLELDDQLGVPPVPTHPAAKNPSGETPGDDDLQRLQRSVAWLKRERAIVEREAEIRRQHDRRSLPRARGLDPVSGIPPGIPPSPGQTRRPPTFSLAPPRPFERIQAPVARRERAHNLPEALCILIAIVIAGSIAYHISVGKLFATEPAHAASLHAP
jgi:hypothetical protein